MKNFLLFSILLVTACAHEPVTLPSGPGGVIVATDATGVVFNNDGKLLWTREGVPAEWFTPDGANWHIDDPLYHAGNQIRLNRANEITNKGVVPASR